MAITILNSSKCSICSKEMKENDTIFSFPSFIQNANDVLFQFNDNSFHSECLRFHPQGTKAMKLADEFITKTRPENRICVVGGNLVKKMDDYIFIDLLTSDEIEPLYNFRFTRLDSEGHSNTTNPAETGPHINYWWYTK